nr:uncharacterized protein LOC118877746 isoform X1 [Drosophila suzukii]
MSAVSLYQDTIDLQRFNQTYNQVSIWRSWRGSTREYQWEGAYPTARVIARKYLYSGATSNTISDLFIGESLDSTTTSYLPLEEKTCWREREEKKSPPAKRPLSDQSDC